MDPEKMFDWDDADVILRATHDTDSRDFRVHKLFLSYWSPVFRDMFKLPQPSSATSTIDVVDVTDSPRALDAILRFIYPSIDIPVIHDLAFLSEILAVADKYDIGVARSRLRRRLAELAATEPLKVYAIACRLGFEDEMKVASSYTTSIDLLGLTELPDEFKSISATEYHRLIHLHSRYRKASATIATNYRPPTVGLGLIDVQGSARAVFEAPPLNYESFMKTLLPGFNYADQSNNIGKFIRSVFDQANALNLTV